MEMHFQEEVWKPTNLRLLWSMKHQDESDNCDKDVLKSLKLYWQQPKHNPCTYNKADKEIDYPEK